MINDEKPDDVKVERDHPQTRKVEPDARGSSEWREDVVPPEGEREGAEKSDKPVWALGAESHRPFRKTLAQVPLSTNRNAGQ